MGRCDRCVWGCADAAAEALQVPLVHVAAGPGIATADRGRTGAS
ncbi:MAG: hypothetical protein DRI90_16390 [Deltaproteobacteria bacterium]|nr:MAG: hypothetical protein DRI90_16390 [Deltaproteobacteria bacterium]